jgi:hypothetical protein
MPNMMANEQEGASVIDLFDMNTAAACRQAAVVCRAPVSFSCYFFEMRGVHYKNRDGNRQV